MKSSQILLVIIVLISFLSIVQVANAETAIVPTLPNNLKISNDNSAWHWSDVAFDGTNYLVVWQTYGGGVSGQFVSKTGALVGSNFPISPSASYHPSVAFNGASYLVVWEDNTQLTGYSGIVGKMVTPQGSVGDMIVICNADSTQDEPSVVANANGDFLVVWADARLYNNDHKYHIFGQRISSSGSLIGQNFRISPLGTNQLYPVVASDGSGYLVSWIDELYSNAGNWDIYAARVSASGEVLDPSSIAICTAPGYQGDSWHKHGICYNNGNYLVAWADSRNKQYQQYVARVSTDGALIDGPSDTAGICVGTCWDTGTRIASDGTNWLVTWYLNGAASGVRISPSGVPLDTTPLTLSKGTGSGTYVGLAGEGTNFLMTWNYDGGSSGTTIFGQILAPGEVNRPPVAVNDIFTTYAGASIGGNVLANDNDPDGNPLTAYLNGAPSHGQLTLNRDGSFTYKPYTGYTGQDVFYYNAYDGQLYSDWAMVSITVNPADSQAPATTASFGGTQGSNGWYISGVTVTLSASDSGSGVAKTEYSLDGSSWSTYAGPLTYGDGVRTLYYRSTDNVGNVEAAKQVEIKVDTAAPTTVLSESQTAVDIQVTLAAGDNAGGSGVQLTEYSVNNINWYTYTSTLTFDRAGTTTLYYRSKDNAGNLETTKVKSIESPAPASVFDLYASFPHTNGENGVYFQYRSGGNYYDLSYIPATPAIPYPTGYAFGTPGRLWNIPVVYQVDGHIMAHPSAISQCGLEADTIIRVTIPGDGGQVQVTGQAGVDSGASVRFYIYKGADGYNNPIWSANGAGSFDFTISYAEGEQLFFATDAGSSDVDDHGWWQDIQLTTSPAPTPTPTPTPGVFDLKENIPQYLSGENGVYLQYRANGNYVDLVNRPLKEDPGRHITNWFGTIGQPWEIPCVCIDGNHVIAHPSAINQLGLEADTIIRVTIPGDGGQVRVTGQAGEDMGSVHFYIYKGADGYNNPIWSAYDSGSFDLMLSYTGGDQIFFATDAGSDDINDHGWWQNVQLITSSTPPAIGAISLNSGWLNSNAGGTVSYELSNADGARVTLQVYDVDGVLLRTLDVGTQNSGPHSITWDGRDAAGNEVPDGAYTLVLTVTTGDGVTVPVCSASATATVSVDNTAPGTTASLPAPGGSGWYGSDVPVTLSATDGTGSGVASIEYSLDGGSTWTPYAGSFLIVGDGEHTILYRSVDNAGNVGTQQSTTVAIDQTPPAMTPEITGTTGSNGWYTGKVSYSLTPTDTGSGVGITQYKLDNGEWTDYSGPITVTDGIHTIACRTTDNAGNVYEPAPVTVKVDTVAPAITAGKSAPNANGWYNANLEVTFTATDATSGVDTVTPAALLTMEGAGQSVEGTATDEAGNTATVTIDGINIDKTPPSITGSRLTGPNGFGWNNGDVTVRFAANDGLSGLKTPGAEDVVISAEGSNQQITRTAEDLAGNTATATVDGINIDRTAPVLSYVRTPANSYGWNNGPVTVSFSATDALSGLDSYSEYPMEFTGEGTNMGVAGTARDRAGNVVNLQVDGINIDLTPPTITGAATAAPNANGWYSTDVTVHFTATDAGGSGIASVTPDVVISTEGAGQAVPGVATDKAGNSASYTVGGINTDRTAPVPGTVNVPLEPTLINKAIPVNVTYAETNADKAIWDWGDSTAATETSLRAVSDSTARATHAYASPGVYVVTVTIIDMADNRAAATSSNYVVVYDPNGGFVTGGGWIDSPAGAYGADPALAGKASFGFVSKYQKGSNVPTGNTEFQFKAGNLNFKSTSYDWLVVAGAKAQYKGTGTINGAGSYRFILTAIDGDQLGKGKPDTFRIRIWDEADGGIVYDNQMNAPDSADPTTLIGGGSIVVHKS